MSTSRERLAALPVTKSLDCSSALQAMNSCSLFDDVDERQALRAAAVGGEVPRALVVVVERVGDEAPAARRLGALSAAAEFLRPRRREAFVTLQHLREDLRRLGFGALAIGRRQRLFHFLQGGHVEPGAAARVACPWRRPLPSNRRPRARRRTAARDRFAIPSANTARSAAARRPGSRASPPSSATVPARRHRLHRSCGFRPAARAATRPGRCRARRRGSARRAPRRSRWRSARGRPDGCRPARRRAHARPSVRRASEQSARSSVIASPPSFTS